MPTNSIPGQAGRGGRLRDRIGALERDFDAFKSMRGPGIMTSITTKGVFQTAKPGRVTAAAPQSTKVTARWA